LIAQVKPQLHSVDVLALRAATLRVHASDALIGYVQELLAQSRRQPGVKVGLSPRAGLALLRAARAQALIQGRDHVVPDDVQALFSEIATHRLVPDGDDDSRDRLAKKILHAVAVD
ncbi:MAG TPA: ATPase, partial [Xanthomonadaceae bacterium]|nr:ATPase [Xanthomonadaceae bacterium]